MRGGILRRQSLVGAARIDTDRSAREPPSTCQSPLSNTVPRHPGPRHVRTLVALISVERIGLVVNDLPTVESKAPSQFGGVLLASAPARTSVRVAPDKG